MFRGLLEMAIYGGRIQNNLDVSILHAYLLQYFNDDKNSLITANEMIIPPINLKIPLLSSTKVVFFLLVKLLIILFKGIFKMD